MSWLTRLRNVFRADKLSREIEREMAFHLAERTDELVAAGASPEAARREAERRFGSELLQRDNTRDRDVLVWLETLLGDFRYGLRGLRRSPVFAVAAVLTLAIGIGANTAVFTLLHGLLLRSLPVPDPQDLARIGLAGIADAPPAFVLPYKMIQQLRQEQRSFVDLSVWREASITLPDPDGTLRHYQAALVSGNAFEVLGARPRLGRLINASDDVRGGPSYGWPVVLSDGFWRDRFGADPRTLGASLLVSGTPVTIVGVAPPSFHGVWPGVEPRLYLPLNYNTVLQNGRDDLNSPTAASPVWCAVIGRLRPGVSHADASVEMAAYQRRLLQEFTPKDFLRNPRFANVRLLVESARTGLPTFFGRTYSAPLFLMQGLVALVLVLCCVNVSGLMMSKLHERQHEFAVRTAIGAGRLRLVRQCLAESFVIALSGAALGATVAWYGTSLLLPFFRHPNMGTGLSVQPDHTVFAVSAGLAVLTTLFFGLWPAWRAGASHPGALLKSRLAAQRRLSGRGFVAIQLALSVVLVVSATLLSRSLVRLRGEPTGFDLDHVTIQTPPFNRLAQKGAAKLDVYQRMVDRIGQGQGVRSAAVTWFTPMTGSQVTARFQALGDGTTSPEEATLAYNAVGPGYFRTMETAILAGREFETRERSTEVCVLNQAAASFLFPGQAAVDRYVRTVTSPPTNRGGDRLFAQPVTCRVVGVAEDAKFASLNEPPPRTIYFPVTADVVDGNLVFLLNGPTKAGVIAAYSDALREIAPTIPLVLFATLREQMDAALGSQRAFTLLSTFFAGVALLLSAIGLYGMLSSSVTQRTGEIGIRAALGASRGVILRMIFADALRLVALGVGLGTIGLFFASGPIHHMLYGVSVFDASTVAATAGLLALVVLTATFWPARRAASVDPMRAMRAE
jgi:putative ABC transport system permease protein